MDASAVDDRAVANRRKFGCAPKRLESIRSERACQVVEICTQRATSDEPISLPFEARHALGHRGERLLGRASPDPARPGQACRTRRRSYGLVAHRW